MQVAGESKGWCQHGWLFSYFYLKWPLANCFNYNPLVKYHLHKINMMMCNRFQYKISDLMTPLLRFKCVAKYGRLGRW